LPVFGWSAWLLLLYLAALSATAFALWGVLLKYNRVSTVSVYFFLIPVFGAALSALFLGESLWAWKNLAALALVSLGIGWVNQSDEKTA
jgi:drug/metabolite transporter (DMT)-like permease